MACFQQSQQTQKGRDQTSWYHTRRGSLTGVLLLLSPNSRNPIPNIVHYFWSEIHGSWSKVVHYIGNRVPFRTHTLSLPGQGGGDRTVPPPSTRHPLTQIMWSFPQAIKLSQWLLVFQTPPPLGMIREKHWIQLWYFARDWENVGKSRFYIR